ncbi:MAG: bifunctional [glutamine synthetase] adenylyltransferase/[glutamine synthetase]-adenylyl-L-tyrosine phosphorylase, partial [Promicromonosporaceae bacterium]|nr:bifunctional [glutamine synthetase] adenylyltransferase/[glutamine synthetase]-adenylyl-L-tyrosine phosphorylase [Promicromonosporaceae bacterium]
MAGVVAGAAPGAVTGAGAAARSQTLAARLRGVGLVDVARAEPLWRQAGYDDHTLAALGEVADPDLALLALVRLAEVSPSPAASPSRRLLAVLGASAPLGEFLLRHPARIGELELPGLGVSQEVTASVGDFRSSYLLALARIAADDLLAADPEAGLPSVAAALSDLAAAALQAALDIARTELGTEVPLAVIGMGKAGGRELNYLSDVDVMFVAAAGATPAELQDATRLAARCAAICSSLWELDTALRPEGKAGPLVRPLDGYLDYYRKWAENWEFQALLKARPLAGDAALGEAFTAGVGDLVWTAVERPGLVSDVQAMRHRVVTHLPPAQAERDLKLGQGGLRDVEFPVQLLQLVHGRTDASLHLRSTLDALEALAQGGYLARPTAAELAEDYRFLRLLEHRLQLHRLRRTHLLPDTEAGLRRLARCLRSDVPTLSARLALVRRRIRGHRDTVFFSPLLPQYARLSPGEITLAPSAARQRLAAAGFADPEGALQHIAALTAGTGRTAAIQRRLLPVLLGWFAEGIDPDAGLLAFRRLSEAVGAAPWYLKLLRDSGAAAQRLTRVLSSSAFLAAGIERSPEAVRWLDEQVDLGPRPLPLMQARADSMVERHAGPAQAVQALRGMRARELTRIGLAEVLHTATP